MVTFEKWLRDLYEIKDRSTFRLLHQGENTSFRLETKNRKLVVRRYREATLPRIESELAWIEAFRPFLNVPVPIRNRQGSLVSSFSQPDKEVYFVAWQAIEGEPVTEISAKTYRRLGELLRLVHNASNVIASQKARDWVGFQRPRYDSKCLLDDTLVHIRKASFLDPTDIEGCESLAAILKQRVAQRGMKFEAFLHGDLYLGNVLQSGTEWYCLDFDECGFGNHAYDLGVARLDLLALNEERDLWPHFIDGYQSPIDFEVLAIGTAMRMFFNMALIPRRLDMPAINQAPESYVRRYLNYIRADLNLLSGR